MQIFHKGSKDIRTDGKCPAYGQPDYGETKWGETYCTEYWTQIDIDNKLKSEIKFEDERSVIQLSLSVMKRALNEHLHVPIIPSGSALEGTGFNSEQNQAIVDEQHPLVQKLRD